ncbi:hypothetical protein [Deinococcus maricopensis]|uniref:Uncharacterized protein n=1 Tax=Deinococcus maricopensis (strain DSM 21211 / LMG 22137 / NRRL B-23946 / LB-34) TaxID=709986 RepID=E8U381_DEIML|nr:hypothetical protein [Deinococcus maricopensis]ADV66026.1 hypothetical protein Deima_0365 [Deinococcus maricopensis DSM 21211]
MTLPPARLDAYREALRAYGLTPGQPYRVLAVLTTGLPGEAIEVAVLREDGSAFVRRAFPSVEVEVGAARVHGLDRSGLLGEAPLAEWREALLAELRGFTVRAWAAAFALQALNAALAAGGAEPIQGTVTGVQDLLERAYPDEPRPALRAVCLQLQVPVPDGRSALGTAQATRAVVDALLS